MEKVASQRSKRNVAGIEHRDCCARAKACPANVMSPACNKANLMHYLPSVYFVNQTLHVSGIFVAHHLEVYCTYTAIGTLLYVLLTVHLSTISVTDQLNAHILVL